jgi:hypothetical protein
LATKGQAAGLPSLCISLEMHHYDAVPQQLQDKIIEKEKAEHGAAKEEGE